MQKELPVLPEPLEDYGILGRLRPPGERGLFWLAGPPGSQRSIGLRGLQEFSLFHEPAEPEELPLLSADREPSGPKEKIVLREAPNQPGIFPLEQKNPVFLESPTPQGHRCPDGPACDGEKIMK